MEGLSLGTISTALQDVSSSVQQRQHLKQVPGSFKLLTT